jgi:hypothetical protein
VHLLQQVEPGRPAARVVRKPSLYARPEAVPAREHDAALSPREHPRNRTEVLDAGAGGARSRAAADIQLKVMGDAEEEGGGEETATTD